MVKNPIARRKSLRNIKKAPRTTVNKIGPVGKGTLGEREGFKRKNLFEATEGRTIFSVRTTRKKEKSLVAKMLSSWSLGKEEL